MGYRGQGIALVWGTEPVRVLSFWLSRQQHIETSRSTAHNSWARLVVAARTRIPPLWPSPHDREPRVVSHKLPQSTHVALPKGPRQPYHRSFTPNPKCPRPLSPAQPPSTRTTPAAYIAASV